MNMTNVTPYAVVKRIRDISIIFDVEDEGFHLSHSKYGIVGKGSQVQIYKTYSAALKEAKRRA